MNSEMEPIEEEIEGAFEIRSFLEALPSFTPAEMSQKIQSAGYIGQEKALKALSLMAFRHVKRLRQQYLEGIPRHELPTKDNYLFLGPTGCGKTYLIELVFQHILSIPTVIVDITAYSETGYIGQDPTSIMTRLVNAAGNNYDLASIGVVCIDEFDKIASGQNNAVFSGQGTTKDVSGLGVQRELLKMLEDTEVEVATDLTHSSWANRETFNTGNVAFIACGAFSGLPGLIDGSTKEHIGFGSKNDKELRKGIAVSLNRNDLSKVAYFQSYGMLPELIGRFSRIVPFDALGKEDLKEILLKNTLRKYHRELELENIRLEISEAVSDLIVEDALDRETGARGLKLALLEFIEQALFEAYSSKKKIREISLFAIDGEIEWKLT